MIKCSLSYMVLFLLLVSGAPSAGSEGSEDPATAEREIEALKSDYQNLFETNRRLEKDLKKSRLETARLRGDVQALLTQIAQTGPATTAGRRPEVLDQKAKVEKPEPWKENYVFFLTMRPSEDGQLDARVFPIAVYRAGEYMVPDFEVESATDIWSATFAKLGELTVWADGRALGSVRVSEATERWEPMHFFVEGIVSSDQDGKLADLYERIPPAEWVEDCPGYWEGATATKKALALARVSKEPTNTLEDACDCWQRNRGFLLTAADKAISVRRAIWGSDPLEGLPILLDLRYFDLNQDDNPEMFVKFGWRGYYTQYFCRCGKGTAEILLSETIGTQEAENSCRSTYLFAVDIDNDGIQELVFEISTDYNTWYEVYQFRIDELILVAKSKVFGC